ncbi:hypothetical protein DW119_03335 [Bifidobacterium pseudocatenulatum]|nr:hypothetical protein DWV80_03065 [Bifidobacterium pseudocatenulatum]RGW29378.1 hypothetical protein DWV79_06630 [Bifidobacterium pseudocatenulatum]RGW51962.1 hypothetical protein DWV66_06540 [Bifidobacterium pseudocatenulatum]RHC34804.1 hypothetical protein DW847_07100 [Bifidobacterium pseudocatenulatum]RHJ50568.1 hypothetical protein DW119_03335 [Bifidobacterium pseudocatenulatum]
MCKPYKACLWAGTPHQDWRSTVTTDDKEMWRINIENDTDMVCSMYGSETAESVFRRHGATCFDDLSPACYEEVFGDLELMINDD